MKTLLIKAGMMMLIVSSIVTGCKKKDIPDTVPQVSTTGMSEVTGTTATGGGNISSDGGATVTISGLCYSKTNQTPTISDDTTKTTATSGNFSSMLKNLQPSATYYVRAYATNSMGTGYGAVVTFTTGNGAPTATGVSVTGTARVGEELTAAYTYSDPENNPQSGTTFQWYIATAVTGTGEAAIAGATTSKYQVKAADEFKFIRVSITPKSSAGTANGAEVKSAYIGPVDVESVTFTYNGHQVTYGVITSSVTGRKWLDRNLGAKRAATALDDYQAYGDLFQWGRAADGHQLITWSAKDVGNTTNIMTSVLSTSDHPGHSEFILTPIFIYDWLSPQNDNLWQSPTYINNPCPNGWHLPSKSEWEDENIILIPKGFQQLRLTAAGFRKDNTGDLSLGGETGSGGTGYYWSSSPKVYAGVGSTGVIFNFKPANSGSTVALFDAHKGQGNSCRCIKNQ